MSKTTKTILSVLLIYLCIACVILFDNTGYDNMCGTVFSSHLCHSALRYLFILLPCVLFGIYLMWERNIVELKQTRKTKNIESKKTKTMTKKADAPKQKMIGCLEAFSNFFYKAGDFLGTAQRSEFWWVVFGATLLYGLLSFVPHGKVITEIVSILLVLPMASLGARRLHDLGTSAKILFFPTLLLIVSWLLLWICFSLNVHNDLSFIVFDVSGDTLGLYSLVLLATMLLPTKKTDNAYSNLKESEHHNKLWINLAYLLYFASLYPLFSQFLK